MRVELASLEGGKGEFAHTYAQGELLLEEDRLQLIGDATVSGSVRRDGNRVHAAGQLVARLNIDCDRCLKAVEFPVASRFKLEYVTKADYEAEQVDELGVEDLDLSVYDGETIDIDALVTEELLLAVPEHVLCSETCKGICPNCGADRNQTACDCESKQIDPRWAALKGIVGDSKS